MLLNDLYNMFDTIALPFYKNAKIDGISKEKKILEILKDKNAYYENGVGIIVPAKTKAKKIIVSHIDLVGNFNIGFSQGRKFTLNGDKLYGALDNTLTNAFLLLAILELSNDLDDVEFLFTEGEESGLTGMFNYMDTKYDKESNPFFINLDVTNDNEDYSVSIEFDYPNKNICKQIYDFNKDIGFTNIRFTDDTSAITRYTKKAFSCCVPTWNYCHTYESYCLVSSLETYYNTLVFLIKDLNVDNYSNDIQFLNNENVQNF